MSVYRLALDELIWLARACGVERLPDWRGALRSDGEICAQLRRKRLMLPGEGGRDCLDPVFAYLFSRMRRALAAAALGADGFLYLSDPLILLERERDPARVRLTAFENEAACASCLREAGLAGGVLTLPPDCPAELRQLAERLVKGDE